MDTRRMRTPKEEIFLLFGKAERLLEAGDAERAVNEATKARRLVRKLPAADRTELEPEVLVLLADCLIEAGRPREALPAYSEMRALAPDNVEVDSLEAVARFHLWEFDAALRLLDSYERAMGASALSLYYRSLALEFSNQQSEAELFFKQAAEMDPESFPAPVRLDEREVEQLVHEVLESLPEDVQRAIGNVHISVVSLPDRHLHQNGIDPLTLGVYTGTDLLSESYLDGQTSLNRIEIFQRNIERIAADRDEVKEELRITLLHEIGHHLGWDEHELHERGLG